MYPALKISDHEHTGSLRPHEHTSYLPLAFLILLTGVILGIFSIVTIGQASADHPPPQSGSVGLSGTVPTTPPKVGATIGNPHNGQHFSSSPITVTGTCPADTIVEVYKNNIFGGSTPCDKDGKYSMQIDLLFGQNVIMAQVYDVLNQSGPQSETITVFYDASLALGAPIDLLNFNGTQLLLNTDAVYRGAFPGQSLNVPISIVGGTAPYAVNVVWGDSNNKLIPHGDNSTFNASHSYDKPGTYQITLQGSDSKQQVAFLTVAAIVNGQPNGVGAGGTTNGGKKGLMNKLVVLWPVYVATATMVASFWLGERREKKVLGADHPKTPPLGVGTH